MLLGKTLKAGLAQLNLLSNFCKFSVRSREGQVMGRQDSYEDMDEPLLMRGQEHQVIIVGFPDVGLLAEPSS